MTTNNDTAKYLWMLSVVFISYLLIGSFIVSRDYFELTYLLILYASIIVTKLLHKRVENHTLNEE